MFKIIFFVPDAHLETVKKSIFATGAGRIGNYDQCCWQTLGKGQFRALEGSDPFIGEQGEVQQVEEYRVELVCEDHLINKAIAALQKAHPYEEPAYDVIQLKTLG